MSEFNRWWMHIWELSMWRAIFYLCLVAFRAFLIGGGAMLTATGVPMLPRTIMAALVGVGLSVFTGIAGVRARLGEDW